MRTPRIHHAAALNPGEVAIVQDQAARHLLKVLRLRVDNPVILFNGDGRDHLCRIIAIEKNRLSLLVEEHLAPEPEPALHLHLGIPLSKGQRMDFAIQKSVELGVTEITPLTTSRSVVRLDEKRLQGKMQHWKQVMISACEQSGRSRLPVLNAPQNLLDWSSAAEYGIVLDPRAETTLRELDRPEIPVHLVAGPEGGFTPDEIERLLEQGFHAVSLGPRILRTETAPLAVISALQLLWGDF